MCNATNKARHNQGTSVYRTGHRITVNNFHSYYRCVFATEEVRQGLNYALRHALACTINCVLLAITHAYKCSWQLKPRFSRYFAGGSDAQKAYFLKAKIMDLKIGLNCKSISVSHSPEIR